MARTARDAHTVRLTEMIRSRTIYSDAALTVRVIESVETWCSQTTARCGLMGRIEPVAVIVRGPDGEYALDIDAQPIGKDYLSQMLEGAAR